MDITVTNQVIRIDDGLYEVTVLKGRCAQRMRHAQSQPGSDRYIRSRMTNGFNAAYQKGLMVPILYSRSISPQKSRALRGAQNTTRMSWSANRSLHRHTTKSWDTNQAHVVGPSCPRSTAPSSQALGRAFACSRDCQQLFSFVFVTGS